MFRPILFTCIIPPLLIQYVLSKELPRNAFKDIAIDSGIVRGSLAQDGDYYAFLGIPYAMPPIGGRRFKAALPPEPWDDIFIANRTVVCPQRGVGQEDCLIINVFTPTKFLDGPLPVLFYIHGGSFLIGSGQTAGAEPLTKQNVILVTLNYRLGVLGFLCLGIEEAPGNTGLKDQVAALKWVNRNIDKFGGDPNKVTLYGMSAGGASVEMLVLSKMAQGLFQGAIVEGGTASAVWTIDTDPTKTAHDLAMFLDFPKETKNLYELADYYHTKPADELSIVNYGYYQNLTDGTFGFVPCLEKKHGKDPFLTTDPTNILKKGKYHKVPMMFIFATFEGLFLRSSDYYELNYKDRMNADFSNFVPADLIFDSKEIKDMTANIIRGFYFGNESIGDNTLTEYLNYFGDHLILHGLLNSTVAQANNGNQVYLLEFSYKGKLGSYERFYDHIDYAGHGDAVKHVILNRTPLEKEDILAVDRMSEIVANFAKYSNPNPTRTELLPIHWPAVQPEKLIYLRLNKDLEIHENPYWERKLFWDKLYNEYRRALKAVDPDLT